MSSPQKKRTIDPETKKEKVLQTARSLFVQKGYYSVTIPDLVRASGVSTGSIYNYFPNKEALARHIHEETISEFHRLFMERLSGRKGTYQKLRAFAELVFDLTESDPEMMEYIFFMKHGEFLPDTRPLCFSEPLLLIQATVAEGIRLGELEDGDAFLSAVAFTGVILRASELRILCVLTTPLPDIGEELIDKAWRAIRAAKSPPLK